MASSGRSCLALIGASFGCWMGMPPPVANIAKLDMLARFFRNSQRGTSFRIHDCRTYFILTANRVRVLRRLSPIRAYSVNLNLRVKVLDFVKSGGPKWMVGGTIFEMWLGSL